MTISTERRKSLCADGWTVPGSRNHSKPSICWWSTCGDIQGKSHTNALWVKGAELQDWMEELGLCREKSSTDTALPDPLSIEHLLGKLPSLLENFYVCFIIQLRQMTRGLGDGIHEIIWPTSSSLKCKEALENIFTQSTVCLSIEKHFLLQSWALLLATSVLLSLQ